MCTVLCVCRNRLVEKIVQRDYQLEDFKLCTTCLIDKTLASMHCGVRTITGFAHFHNCVISEPTFYSCVCLLI